MKPFAFLKITTTGSNPGRHEVLELAVLRACAKHLALDQVRTVRVRPERLEQADRLRLAEVGYSPKAWADAVPLRDALRTIDPLLEGAVLAGHHLGTDRRFLEAAHRWSGLRLPRLAAYTLDTADLLRPLAASGQVRSLALPTLCAAFGIACEPPARAVRDARCALELARCCLRSLSLPRAVARAFPRAELPSSPA
jgi:DNA polymerase-3 subunit epsilon